MLVAKLDRLSHDVHFISGLMSVTHLIETTAKLRMPHPWAADAVLHVENLVTPVEAKLATATRPAHGAKWWRAS